jgi:hypothetical protein
MKRLVLIAAAALAAGLPAPAAAATVDVMVVGREGVLKAPKQVRLKPRTVKVAGRRCRVGGATPLSVLAARGLRLKLRDYGRCGRRARDAGGLYVRSLAGQRERGVAGWVYKVGRRLGTTGGADPTGPFGTGRRLRGGRLLWFWCAQNRAGGCQRTLDARPEAASVAAGAPLRVTVRGYDDNGRGVPVAGALVRAGGAQALTGADGVATVTVPAGSAAVRVTAERDGMVRSFPVRVAVG